MILLQTGDSALFSRRPVCKEPVIPPFFLAVIPKKAVARINLPSERQPFFLCSYFMQESEPVFFFISFRNPSRFLSQIPYFFS